MPDQPIALTRTQYEAFNLTFDAIRRAPVVGPEQYRVADPLSKVAHLFEAEEDGSGFIALLVNHRLFEGGVGAGPNGAIPCYVACLERWLDFVARVKVVPDPPSPPAPPFTREEKRLSAKRDEAVRRRDELRTRREALARELAEADAGLETVGTDIVRLDGLLDKVRLLAEEFRAELGGPVGESEVVS